MKLVVPISIFSAQIPHHSKPGPCNDNLRDFYVWVFPQFFQGFNDVGGKPRKNVLSSAENDPDRSM
jgi:hypothetical protein